jgi:dTDP-4-amino-4,6-dideoxygalactose transaminase
VLVEIDDTFTMDPADLDRKITPRSRLIVPVHMCGVPCQIHAIMDIARRNKLPVLEDCAQANGATLNGCHIGTFGDIAVFSFQMNKNITAGEGGIVVTDDETLYLRANAAHDLGSPWVGGMPDQTSDHALWGHGARMSELCAAIVRVQLRKIDTIVGHMRASKRRIRDALRGLAGVTWRRIDDEPGDSGPFLIVRFETPSLAKTFAEACSQRGLTAARLPDYGLHIYYNVKALVERRSNRGRTRRTKSSCATMQRARCPPRTHCWIARSCSR